MLTAPMICNGPRTHRPQPRWSEAARIAVDGELITCLVTPRRSRDSHAPQSLRESPVLQDAGGATAVATGQGPSEAAMASVDDRRRRGTITELVNPLVHAAAGNRMRSGVGLGPPVRPSGHLGACRPRYLRSRQVPTGPSNSTRGTAIWSGFDHWHRQWFSELAGDSSGVTPAAIC